MPYDKPSEKRIELEDEFIMPPAVLYDEKVDEAYENFINTCGCDKGKSEFYIPILEALGEEKDYPWDQCIEDNKDKGMDSAKKICGSIKAKSGGEAEDTARYTDPISGKDYSSGSELEAALDMEKQALSVEGDYSDNDYGRADPWVHKLDKKMEKQVPEYKQWVKGYQGSLANGHWNDAGIKKSDEPHTAFKKLSGHFEKQEEEDPTWGGRIVPSTHESKYLHTITSKESDMSESYATEGPVSAIHNYMKPQGRRNVMIKSGIDEETANKFAHHSWNELPDKIQIHLLSKNKVYDQTPVTDRKSQMPTESISNEVTDETFDKTWDHVNKNHPGHWDGWFGMEKDFFDEAGVKDEDHPKVAMNKVDNHIENLYKKKDPRVYDPSMEESYSKEHLANKDDQMGDRGDKDDQEGDQGEKDVKEVDEYSFVEYGKIKVSCEACNDYTTLPDQESALSYAREHQMKLGYAHVCTFD